MNAEIAQVNLSHTERAGTVRGIHYQRPPAEEAKLVRCVRGRSWHALVDARPEAAARFRTETVELREGDARALYVAEGVGHGFQALEDHTAVLYLASGSHAPTWEAGLRPDDPALAIPWPLPPSNLSDKDRAWPLLNAEITADGARDD
jgi:dTDP-4-dehydrorhamnose 3,5-epimerase